MPALAGTAVVLLSILGVSVPATAAVPAATGGVTMTIGADSGGVVDATQSSLNVTLTVDDTGADIVPAGTAVLWMVPTPIASASGLSSWLAASGSPSTKTQLGTTPTGPIEPGIPISYRISVPVASLPIAGTARSATFGIGVSLLAGTQTTAVTRSAVVWNPNTASSTSPHPAQVAIAMPLTVPPSATGIISAADLATYTAPNGVLTRQLDAIIANPEVAVGIDPMIIASIRALNTAAPPSAVNWLRQLSGIGNPTFALQYGDADPAGQIQSGISKLLAPTDFTFAMNPADFKTPPTPIGEPSPGTQTAAPTPSPAPGTSNPNLLTTKELLAWPYTLSGVAWPADDSVRVSDLSALVANGLHTTILSSGNTNAASLSATPNAVVRSGKAVALAADESLSDAVRDATVATTTTQWNAAMAEVNAQLQLIAAQGTSPTILVTLDRESPTAEGQLAHVLSSVADSPWSTAATFQDALDATPTTGLSVKDAPESASRTDSIQTLVARESAVDQFATVLDDPKTLTGQTRAELLTTLGVGWMNPKQNWEPGVASFLQSTSKTLSSVSILATDNVNLVGTQGSIPFTVSNNLPNEAVTVVLHAVPSNSRLDISGSTTKRIQADSRTSVLVPVKAEIGNGKVTLELQLYSQSGVRIGAPTTVPVEVHADWEGIGALIIGVLLVLLFGFGIVRNVLRRRRADGTAEDAPDEEDLPGEEVRPDGEARPDESASTTRDPREDPRG